MSSNPILVTGGSSPLGDIVLPRLVREQGAVIGLARSAESRLRVENAGATPFEFDFDRPGRQIPNSSVLVHLAGIRFARNIVDLAESCGVKHIVVISSASALTPGHPHRDAVLAGERRLQSDDFRVSILRPTMIYGSYRERNIQRLVGWCRKLPAVPQIAGGGLIMPVLVDDVGSAIAEVLGDANECGPREVSGPEGLRIGDVVDQICLAESLRRLPIKLPVDAAVRLSSLDRRGRSKMIHAVRMLGVDRIVEPPQNLGFVYRPTPLSEGLTVALERYKTLTQ